MGKKRKHNFEEKELSSTKANFRVYIIIIFHKIEEIGTIVRTDIMYVTIEYSNYSLIFNLTPPRGGCVNVL